MNYTKLTYDDYVDMMKLRESGMSYIRLAEIFHVSNVTIQQLVTGARKPPTQRKVPASEMSVKMFKEQMSDMDKFLTQVRLR